MASDYIPKGLWFCGFKLRAWIKEQNGGVVPEEVETWINHLEETAVVAQHVEEARAAHLRACNAMGRFGKDVSGGILRRVDRERALFDAALLELRRHLKDKGPAQPVKKRSKQVE